MLHAGGGPPNSKLLGNNGAATLEHRNLKRRRGAKIITIKECVRVQNEEVCGSTLL